MSSVVRLPPELRTFIELPGHQTLIIRGPFGSGKTTLALALIEAFEGDRFLITNRVGEAELRAQFPWLGNTAGSSVQVVDTSSPVGTVSESARAISKSRAHLMETDLTASSDPTSFLWLPPALQEAWSRLSKSHRPLIVIDSWTALVEECLVGTVPGPGAPDRVDVERLLLRRMGQVPSLLVLILESEEPSSLDYLVNGVVATQRETRDERLQRWLMIQKLRGVRIENPAYPYTLEGARFESIMPAHPYSSLRPARPDPEPQSMPGYLWPGSRDFAAAFGWLPFGKITLIELNDSASIGASDLITLPAATHAIARGGHVLMVPHSSKAPEEVVGKLAEHLSAGDQLPNRLRLMVPRGWIPSKSDDATQAVVLSTRKLEFASPMGDPTSAESVKFVREGASASTPGLFVISVQGLEAVAASIGVQLTPDAVARLPDTLIGIARGLPIHVVVVCRQSARFLEAFRAASSVRLEINIRQGRIFIDGVSPWTSNFVLSEGSEGSAYSLLRIV